MLNNSERDLIHQVLTHRPFDADTAYLFVVVEGEDPVPTDSASEQLLTQHRSSVRSATVDGTYTWREEPTTLDASTTGAGRIYAGCRVGPLLVVVGKRVTPGAVKETEASFDHFYFAAMHANVTAILEGSFPAHAPSKPQPEAWFMRTGGKDSGVTTEEGQSVLRPIAGGGDAVRQEVRALELFERIWRKHYGPTLWLAVKNGTVQAVGETRGVVEQRIAEKGIESPVLYVPPEQEDQVLHVYSAVI